MSRVPALVVGLLVVWLTVYLFSIFTLDMEFCHPKAFHLYAFKAPAQYTNTYTRAHNICKTICLLIFKSRSMLSKILTLPPQDTHFTCIRNELQIQKRKVFHAHTPASCLLHHYYLVHCARVSVCALIFKIAEIGLRLKNTNYPEKFIEKNSGFLLEYLD